MCRLHPSAPSKGAPPGAHHRKERAASSLCRTAASTVLRDVLEGLQPANPACAARRRGRQARFRPW